MMTARELAEHLGVKPGTVLDWYEAKKIPGYKWSRAVRFDLDEVLAAGRAEGGATGGKAPAIPPQRPGRGYRLGLASDPQEREDDHA
jgi:excisionase family DNA binding protein